MTSIPLAVHIAVLALASIAFTWMMLRCVRRNETTSAWTFGGLAMLTEVYLWPVALRAWPDPDPVLLFAVATIVTCVCCVLVAEQPGHTSPIYLTVTRRTLSAMVLLVASTAMMVYSMGAMFGCAPSLEAQQMRMMPAASIPVPAWRAAR